MHVWKIPIAKLLEREKIKTSLDILVNKEFIEYSHTAILDAVKRKVNAL